MPGGIVFSAPLRGISSPWPSMVSSLGPLKHTRTAIDQRTGVRFIARECANCTSEKQRKACALTRRKMQQSDKFPCEKATAEHNGTQVEAKTCACGHRARCNGRTPPPGAAKAPIIGGSGLLAIFQDPGKREEEEGGRRSAADADANVLANRAMVVCSVAALFPSP